MSRDNIAIRTYMRDDDGIVYSVEFSLSEDKLSDLAAKAYKSKGKRAVCGPLSVKVISERKP